MKKKSILRDAPDTLLLGFCLLSVAAICLILARYIPSERLTNQQRIDALARQITKNHEGLAVLNTPWNAQTGAQIGVRAAGFRFLVSSQTFPSLIVTIGPDRYNPNMPQIVQAADPRAASKTIAKELENGGFRRTLPKGYTKDNTTCLELYDNDQVTLTVSCYDSSQVDSYASLLAPFVKAYNTSQKGSAITSDDIVGPRVVKSTYGAGAITSSRVAGYDIAEMVLTRGGNKKLVLFYRHQDEAWKFASIADDEFGFPCSDFTSDAGKRQAFYDQICLSPDGQVRLDANNRALQ